MKTIPPNTFSLMIFLLALLIGPGVAKAQPPVNPGDRAIDFSEWRDQAGTSTLAARLGALEDARRHYAGIRYAVGGSPPLQDEFLGMTLAAADILTTPALKGIVGASISLPADNILSDVSGVLVKSDESVVSDMSDSSNSKTLAIAPDEIDRVADRLLTACAVAVLDQATSGTQLQHWKSRGGGGLYREAGGLYAAILDTLPGVSERQEIIAEAPAPLRQQMILLAKLHELYRNEPPAPSTAPPTSPTSFNIPVPPPKTEAHWQGVNRRIGAFQGVLPRGLLSEEALARRKPNISPALIISLRQIGGLDFHERELTPNLWALPKAEFVVKYTKSPMGVKSWQHLLSISEVEVQYPGITATMAAWELLTEYPGLTSEIIIARDHQQGLKLLWAPDSSHQFPLQLLDHIIFDHSEYLDPINSKDSKRAYLYFFLTMASAPLPVSPGVEYNFIYAPFPEAMFAGLRLELAPWIARYVEPQLIAAGLTTDNPAWADKRDMLAQPYIQSLVKQHIVDSKFVFAGGNAPTLPHNFDSWLLKQLLKDYDASLYYQANIKEWDLKFQKLRDEALADKHPEELWWRIYNIQGALENLVADTMAQMATSN